MPELYYMSTPLIHQRTGVDIKAQERPHATHKNNQRSLIP
jgi:hypothetical protein